MFQGSGNLGKLEFIKLIESNGGLLNGSTRFDFTNYFEIVPAHTLETMLWAEADRMKGLAIDSSNLNNQRDVVKNEVRVNVLNQPYGSFPWIDLPMAANQNWFNAHNFYGDLHDLDAATLTDASAFFRRYYAPNNAVLVVVGDFVPTQAKAWIQKYFAAIPQVELPAAPDLSEPPQQTERHASRVDSLANRPAVGAGLACAAAVDAGVVRLRTDRPDPGGGAGLAVLPVPGFGEGIHQRCGRGDQLRTGAPVQLRRPDVVDRFAVPRQRGAPGFAGRRGGPRCEGATGYSVDAATLARAPHQDAFRVVRHPGAVLGIRAAGHVGVVRAVRQRSGTDQPAGGRIPEGDPGTHSTHGPRVSPSREPHGLHHRPGAKTDAAGSQ